MKRLLGWRVKERVSGMAPWFDEVSVELDWPMSAGVLELRLGSLGKVGLLP